LVSIICWGSVFLNTSSKHSSTLFLLLYPVFQCKPLNHYPFQVRIISFFKHALSNINDNICKFEPLLKVKITMKIMKNRIFLLSVFFISLISFSVFSQTEKDTILLGLPGDNLDLYGVLELFQKSKTIEDFEKVLNEEKTGLNNLDLNLDKKVDFIKVTTKQKDQSFSFVLQVDVTEKEIQDVAVILVDKDKDGKVSLQIVGDKDLYGKDYVIEPKTVPTPSVTANPAYTGDNPVTVNVPASTTVVVVESAPIVQYVYSPAYVPYYPPYYYGYYPPYFAAFTVMAVGIYHHNCYHYHGGYHGGHYGGGNNVYIHNENNFNNYNNNRNTSNTVNNNRNNGKYGNASNRASAGTSNRASAGNSAVNRPSTNQSKGSGASARPSTNQTKSSASNRASTSNYSSPSKSNYSSTSRSNSSSRSNYSSPSRSNYSSPSRSYSGGGSRGGGGGGRRR
jgi:uncharacterized membrane protein YgcG